MKMRNQTRVDHIDAIHTYIIIIHHIIFYTIHIFTHLFSADNTHLSYIEREKERGEYSNGLHTVLSDLKSIP